MWKSAGLLVVGGGLAYTYVVEPAWVNWGLSETHCWMKGGVYIAAGPQEEGYVTEMNNLIQNRARLETGEAKGCLPEAKCALDPAAAVGMIDRKIASWGVSEEYHKTKLKALNYLHDGKGFDLPGDGVATKVDSMARLDEAAYCTKYLYQTRATLVKALAEPEKK